MIRGGIQNTRVKMPNKPWTEAELIVLTNAKDKSKINLPNRSKKSIRRKLILLGLIKPSFTVAFHKKKPWSAVEIEKLKNFELTNNERSKGSIARMARKLGLVEKKPFRKPWDKKNIEILIKLVHQGKKPSEIYKMKVLPHTRNSIQKKISSLGIKKEYDLKEKEEKIKNSGGTIKFIEDSLKISRVNFMRERISSNRDIWTGLPLDLEDKVDLNQTDI